MMPRQCKPYVAHTYIGQNFEGYLYSVIASTLVVAGYTFYNFKYINFGDSTNPYNLGKLPIIYGYLIERILIIAIANVIILHRW